MSEFLSGESASCGPLWPCDPQKFGPGLLKGSVLRVWHQVLSTLSIVVRVVTDRVGWVALAFRSRQSLDAEVLFLRRQLALYVERGVKPSRIDAATRVKAWRCCPGCSHG